MAKQEENLLYQFTKATSNAMKYAEQERQQLYDTYVNTGHIFFGIIREIASDVIKLSDIHNELQKLQQDKGRLQNTYVKEASKAINYALIQTQNTHRTKLDVDHLLFGILQVEGSTALKILAALHIVPEDLQKIVTARNTRSK